MCDIVVKRFTFAISSPDEFLIFTRIAVANDLTNSVVSFTRWPDEISESLEVCFWSYLYAQTSADEGGCVLSGIDNVVVNPRYYIR